jgi:hypothetical protein
MVIKLKLMDEAQLLELFHDIGNVQQVERISIAANHFVDNYEEPEKEGENEDEINRSCDYKSRYDDWKSEQNRPY